MLFFLSPSPTRRAVFALGIGLFSFAASAALPPNPAKADVASSAFQFALGKSLAAEGLVTPALEAILAAEKLAPNDPYIKIERAQLELQQPSASRSHAGAADAMNKATQAVESARRLAPENADILRSSGQIYALLAARNPELLSRARDVLEEVRKRFPEDLQTLLQLGDTSMELGDAKRAVEVLSDFARLAPDKKFAADILSQAMIKAGDREGAEKVLRSLLKPFPEALELRLRLADLIQDRGDVAELVAVLAEAPAADREDLDFVRRYATALYLSGDLDGSLALLDRANTAKTAAPNPRGGEPEEDPFLLRLRGLLLAAEGRNAESITFLSRILGESPGDIGVALALARALDRDGRRGEAEKTLIALAEALEKEDKAEEAADVRFALAEILVEAKDWARTINAVQPLLGSKQVEVREQAKLITASALSDAGRGAEALDLLGPETPEPPAIAAKRAEVLAKVGREAESKEAFSRLAATSNEAAIAVAQAYQRMDRYRDAIPILKKVAAEKTDFAPVFFLLGAAHERLGEAADAVQAFRRAIEIAPNFHAALNYLGYLWADRGENLDEALSYVRRAVTLDPENGAYVDSLGWVHFQLKQYDRAKSYLERAVRLLPNDPTAFEHLGDLYRVQGDVAKARDLYRRAVELAGDNLDAVQKKLNALPRR